MRYFALFLLVTCTIFLHSFELKGDVQSWEMEDFISSDTIGDKLENYGDISSLFARVEGDRLFIRITFDDMLTRKKNKMIKDNFAGEEVSIKITIENPLNKSMLMNKEITISDLSIRHSEYEYLRTPEMNLLELSLPWKQGEKPEDLQFQVISYYQGKISDELITQGKSRNGGGNCAFVHHGNQGLTYTEVFYGQYPQETSGFDEVLEVHQATHIPGNFNMSGTLMPAAEWHNPEFNNWLSTGVYEGWAAMMTSALGQHIMPFVHNDMNNWSVHINSEMVRHFYNYNPKVAWVPERVWLSPDNYPNAGVIDWLGDNWEQHGVEAVILDDWPHLNGYANNKIHWMNNGSGINLRVIPIHNDFVGKMHYDADGAKNLIWNQGQHGIAVYGTDWEVAAEMNEHHDDNFLDNYENVLWWCYYNYPAVNVWKLDSALSNPDFNGTGADITPGTYGILGGENGYGGSNNSWYSNWAGYSSPSDFHNPKWTYGYIWNDAYNNLMTAPNNALSQLGWYTLMINLHETGWHDNGNISGWEHHYSSHIKNANVYTEASRWANGDYVATTAAFFSDIDHDGVEELVMHNDKLFAVFESIGGKINWLFYKNNYGGVYSVVSSDMAYWSETDGDYNEGSANHFAALSDVNPNQQNALYQMTVEQGSGDAVQVRLSQWGVEKTIRLETGTDYLDVIYNFFGSTGYIKSGWSPDLLDVIWSGKSNLQRLFGEYASYAGWRNAASGASVAYVLGSAGGNHQSEFEGTLVKGDEIYGSGIFSFRLFAGYTSEPYGTGVSELNYLASQTVDLFGPRVEEAYITGDNVLQVRFNEDIDIQSAQNVDNYQLSGFSKNFQIQKAILTHFKNVALILDDTFSTSESGTVTVSNVKDLDGNITDTDYQTANAVDWISPARRPHLVGTMNGWSVDNHTYDFTMNENAIWEVTASLNAGTHLYKVTESESWNDNDWPSDNQEMTLASSQNITFYANCGGYIGGKSGDEFVFHSPNPPAVIGDFLSELGGSNWDETSTITQMNDDGINGDETANDGIYTFQALIPIGSYECKIVLNNAWTQNTSSNLPFSSDGIQETIFTYNIATNAISIDKVSLFQIPQNLTAKLQGSGILLEWDELAEAASFSIYRNSALLDETTSGFYLDEAVTTGESYTYYITAKYTTPTGESDPSNSVQITFFPQTTISGVSFLDKTASEYTNITNEELLGPGSSLFIEGEVQGMDEHGVSDFAVTLFYQRNEGDWQSKNFNWFSNGETASYWRVQLAYGSEIYNGDNIAFYLQATDYTETIYTDDNNGTNYQCALDGLLQPVLVTFSLNLGGFEADSVAVMGENSPLSWDDEIFMTKIGSIYQAEALFPDTSNDSIYYKYKRYENGNWIWESMENNRVFEIDDSETTQILPEDNWNNQTFSQISGVQFINDLESEFTNFSHEDELDSGNNIFIEAEVDGMDASGNSAFQVQLRYKIDDGSWLTKEFYWFSNVEETEKSYWRVELENGTEISDGQQLHFEILAQDYNAVVFSDNNNGYYYEVSLEEFGLNQDVTVSFSIKMGHFQADSLAIMGSVTPLDWEQPLFLTGENGFYTADVIFPLGSAPNLEYKYQRYDEFEERWIWESVKNRSLFIDDSQSTQTNETDNWNNRNIQELNSVTFFDSTLSEFTNFVHQQELTPASDVQIEVEIDGYDPEDVSGFEITLFYQTNLREWQQKSFYWHSNDEVNQKSYWRVILENGEEIQSGDNIDFYVQSSDYTNSVFTDDNLGNNYSVSLESAVLAQDVTVSFTLNPDAETYSTYSLQGNISPLGWLTGETLLTGPNAQGNFTIDILFPSGSSKFLTYKYSGRNNWEWHWETTENRQIEIDDSQPTMILPFDVWNNGSLSMISGVAFFDKTVSEFTNFSQSDSLLTGENVKIEVEINGMDENANSNFSATLTYRKNGGTWINKPFYWYSNNVDKSYWRVELENGNDIFNGEIIEFYIQATDYTETIYYDSNNGDNYQVSISEFGLSQDVSVTFNLNIGALEAAEIALQGNQEPLSWDLGSSLMTGDNKLYSLTVLFAQGTNKIVEYKYAANINSEKAWAFEGILGNRTFEIDDSDSNMIMDMDFWNDLAVNDLTGVSFLPQNAPSEYTNFNSSQTISSSENIQIEAEVNGIDSNANSGFEVTLHYQIDAGSWQELPFDWYFNNTEANRSYWRVELDNGIDVFTGDQVSFYLSATDYNGPQAVDNNNGTYYQVKIAQTSALQDVEVQFSLKLGTLVADSVFIQGSIEPLNWNVGSQNLTENDNVYSGSFLFPSGSSTEVDYKYALKIQDEWQWETIANRSFFIDDSEATQILDIDFWNDVYIGELTGLQFLQENHPSEFTNFNNNGIIPLNENAKMEILVDGVDPNANSDFVITLHYSINEGSWQEKECYWHQNTGISKHKSGEQSYWRVELINSEDFDNYDAIKFFFSGIDYNGPYHYDGSSENAYQVTVGIMQSPENVEIEKVTQGVLIRWNTVLGAAGYNVYHSSNPMGIFDQKLNSSVIADTLFIDDTILGDTKRFYQIRATDGGE
jgi:hypothetical protein